MRRLLRWIKGRPKPSTGMVRFEKIDEACKWTERYRFKKFNSRTFTAIVMATNAKPFRGNPARTVICLHMRGEQVCGGLDITATFAPISKPPTPRLRAYASADFALLGKG